MRLMRIRSRAMAIGIITGSGTYSLPGFEGSGPEPVATPWGDALVSRGTFAGTEVLHISRHEEGHVRLSNLVTHRANIAALAQEGAPGVLAVTVCGAVDPSVELGSVVCFDDLHFLANRLGDGELCTFYPEPGDRRRGHWIFEDPFSADLRRALLGYATDYANGVQDEPTPVQTLIDMMAASTATFARVLAAAMPLAEAAELSPAGTVYRFDG